MYNFNFRSSKIVYNAQGMREWQSAEKSESYAPSEIAIVIVDMWDKHWSKGAAYRCIAIAEKVNQTVISARNNGVFIVHAPSDTMGFYKDTPARIRALDIEITKPVEVEKITVYPHPVDSSDGGSDTIDDYPRHTGLWTRQSDKIYIDDDKDIVSDECDIIYSHLKKRGIKLIIYMGVHTNMCILGRPFAIMSMLSFGMKTTLVRDLTDAMYNPEKPPYVNTDEGTRLVVEYIEKFYCPTITSGQILEQGK